MDIINTLLYPTFDLAAVGTWVGDLYNSVLAHAEIASLKELVDGYLAMLSPALLAGIYLVLSLIVAFAGKKLLGVMKFLGFFVVGYCLGVYYLMEPIQSVLPDIPSWAIGVVVGAVAALLCALLYFLVYFVGSAFIIHVILFTGTLLPESIATTFTGNFAVSIAVAAGAAVVLLLLRKWVEMLGTAVLGAWLAYGSINAILAATLGYGFDGIAEIAPYLTYVMWGIIAIIALPGFIIQVKTRRRY